VSSAYRHDDGGGSRRCVDPAEPPQHADAAEECVFVESRRKERKRNRNRRKKRKTRRRRKKRQWDCQQRQVRERCCALRRRVRRSVVSCYDRARRRDGSDAAVRRGRHEPRTEAVSATG